MNWMDYQDIALTHTAEVMGKATTHRMDRTAPTTETRQATRNPKVSPITLKNKNELLIITLT